MSTLAKFILPMAVGGIVIGGCVSGNCTTGNQIIGNISNGSYNVDEILNNLLGYCPSGSCGTGNVVIAPDSNDCAEGNCNTGNTIVIPNTGNQTSTDSSYLSQVVELVNAERAKLGLSALTVDTTLSSAAQVRAKESATNFSHTRPNGTYFSSIFNEFGISYRNSGENLAWGQKTPTEVVNAWMNSSGHRANILNASYKKIGVAIYTAPNGTLYWAQLFTN